ncbi:hypothetical protein [Secundilactobacillus kimchicus]|uniref:hypothetical protein n=1 Tax=Secundilactobacillus kimchicus TaxID=528209 RepID=UPI0024A8BACA|nr:hypothetical protein [Secundilactobacillus kimchicus]
MTEDEKPVYWVIPKHDFSAERRIFIEGEKYPVYPCDDYYTLVGENGSFNFTAVGLQKLMEDWKQDANFEEMTEDE